MPRNPNQIGYNGNPNLPLPTEDIVLSASELNEYVKCMNDPIYFIATYVKITQVDEGIVKFHPWKFQEDIINCLETNRFVIAKLPRQSGKSTVIICGYFLWYILFHTDVSVALLANQEDTAIMLLDRLKQSFELLPRFLKQGVEKWDQKLLKLSNKARVRAAATSASAIRGDTFNIVFLDEFAFVPANIAVDFMSSVFPVISSGKTTKLFIVSTPNGFNLFYKIFTDAMEGRNTYKHLQYTWRDVFYARNPTGTEADALKWREDTIQNMGNNEQQFQQEFECDFLGSANTLVGPWKLAQLSFKAPLENRGKLRIYEKPIYLSDDGPAHVYLCGVDVAQGQGQDSSVIQVIDITTSPFKQVAVYQDNTIKPAQLATVVSQVGRWYNDAYVIFEINGEAKATADICHEDLEYPNIIQIFMHKKKGQQMSSGNAPNAKIGLKSTEATKRIGCTGLKSLMENDKLLICDYETKQQLGTFVGKLNKRGLATIYEAEIGNHDDCISPLVLLGWLSMQSGFEDYIGLSMRKLLIEGSHGVPVFEPFNGFFPDSGPQTIGLTMQGVPIVDDADFWNETPAPVKELNGNNWL
jgi:hypothetical protein